MDKNQKIVLKGIGGLIMIIAGLYSKDKLVSSLAFSGGSALLISGIKDILDQNNDTNEIPV
jgi:hypothetical protein